MANPGQTVPPPNCSNESALLVTLQPGSYTAIVRGVGGTTGIGLMEIFGVAWVYDADNRLLSRPGVTYTYDSNGNTTSRTDATGTTIYIYDYENRLIQVTLPGGSVVSYQYDPLGRRVMKTVDGVITRYLYDGEDILKEYDGAGVLLATYVHGPGIDEPVAMTQGGQTYYYHADSLGSIIGLSNSSQAIAKMYQYDSYGNITSQTGSLQNFYMYTGREYDAETGLYYYRARYYAQQTGRFLTQDPIGSAEGDVNLFRYADSVGKPDLKNFYSPMGDI